MSPQEQLVYNDQTYPVSELSEFGFVSPIDLVKGEDQAIGVLKFGPNQLQVDFRVRRKMITGSLCSFSNFSIANQQILKKYLFDHPQRTDSSDKPAGQSYDKLAKSFVSTGSSVPSTTSAPSSPSASTPDEVSTLLCTSSPSPPSNLERARTTPAVSATTRPTRANSDSTNDVHRPKATVNSLASFVMLFAMIGMGALAIGFSFKKTQINSTESNSALVGNYVRVNANVEGETVELLVNEGDLGKKGDVLPRLSNPEIIAVNETLDAQLITANARVKALKSQLETFEFKLELATKKLKLDLQVAESEKELAIKARDSSKAAFERLKPYAKSGAISQVELSEAESELRSYESACVNLENRTLQIKFSQEAIKSKVLVFGDRLEDDFARLSAELEIAEANCRELKLIKELGLLVK